MDCNTVLTSPSPEDTTRPKIENLITIEEEFCAWKGCPVSRLADSFVDPESDGIGRGKSGFERPCPWLIYYSKTKLQAISKMLQIYKKVSFRTMRKHRNMATSSSSFNPNLGILPISAVLSQWPKSTLSSKQLCSQFMEINMRAVKNIYCLPCFRYAATFYLPLIY